MNPWPDHFDFETDETCRRIFRPFIEQSLRRLKDLDAQRPADKTYIFHEHALRVAGDIRATCRHMGLGDVVANNMYWAVLPHDAGKIKLPAALWDVAEKPGEDLKTLRRSHTTLGAQIVRDELGDYIHHPFFGLMTEIMLNHHEQMDGKGYHGLAEDALSLPVRLAAIVEAFDGWSIPRPHFGDRDVSPAAVLRRMRVEKAGMFDPDLLEAFAETKQAGDFN